MKAIFKAFFLLVFVLTTSATSCVWTEQRKVSYELSECPSPEFILPYDVENQALTAKLSWMVDEPAQYSIEWKTLQGGSITYAFIEHGRRCKITLGVHTLSKKNPLTAEELKLKIEEELKKAELFAKALLSHTRFKVVGRPEIELFQNDEDFRRWLTVNKVQPYKTIPRFAE